MSRSRQVLVGILVVLVVLLAINTVVVDRQTKSAGVTIDGGRILRLPGGDLQVYEDGPTEPPAGAAAIPIVLLHCYAGSLHWWDRMAPILARRHRVIRMDLLGHGGSEKPSGDYSIENLARLVAMAMDRLGLDGAVVVGHSIGFDVAVSLAERSTGLVDRLVDIGEAPDNSAAARWWVATLGFVPVIGEAGWRLVPDSAIAGGYADTAVAPDFDLERGFPDPGQPVRDFHAMTYTSLKAVDDGQQEYVDERALDERVRALGIPLLVIFGQEDQAWEDPRAAAESYAGVPGARIATLPGVGHSPNIEAPAETARLILEFAGEAGDEKPGDQPPTRDHRGHS